MSYVLTANHVASLVKLKQLAQSKLKPTSTLRRLILSEQDELPNEEARIKMQMFAKMLYSELEK
jgi:hypothetical protein